MISRPGAERRTRARRWIVGGGLACVLVVWSWPAAPSRSVPSPAVPVEIREQPARHVDWSAAASAARLDAIAGRVFDAAGQPLSQARVCASARDASAAFETRCVSCARDGSYRFVSLPDGSYQLLAAAVGHRPSDGGARFTITASGEPVRRDFVLQAGGARVAGHILDRTGGPIAGATIRVIVQQGAVLSTSSDDDGSFDLTVDEGPLGLRVVADGYSEAQRSARAPDTALRIELSPGARLAGDVVNASGGVIVTAIASAAASFTPNRSVAVDARGRFVIDGLGAGSYVLEARGDGGYGRLTRPVTLNVGQTFDGLQIELMHGVALTGRVVCEIDRRPSAGAELDLASSEFGARAVADASGAFQFRGVPRGAFVLRASGGNCASGGSTSSSVDVRDQDIDGMELVLRRALSLRGRVVDDRGRGVASHNVIAIGTGDVARTTLSRDDGAFELTDLTPGDYRVRLDLIPESSHSITLRVGEPTPPVTLLVPAAGAIRVQLSGTSDDDWVVYAHGTGVSARAMRREDSMYDLTDLHEGHYEISAYDAHGAPLTAACEVRAHATTSITLRAPEHRGQISGTVVDRVGAPIADARVSAVARGGAPYSPNGPSFVLSAADGHFTLTGLSSNVSYDVDADSPLDGHGREQEVSVGGDVRVVVSANNSALAAPPGLFGPAPSANPQ